MFSVVIDVAVDVVVVFVVVVVVVVVAGGGGGGGGGGVVVVVCYCCGVCFCCCCLSAVCVRVAVFVFILTYLFLRRMGKRPPTVFAVVWLYWPLLYLNCSCWFCERGKTSPNSLLFSIRLWCQVCLVHMSMHFQEFATTLRISAVHTVSVRNVSEMKSRQVCVVA